MTDRESEYLEAAWLKSAGGQTKGKINGIPLEFREVAADKCFRDCGGLRGFSVIRQ